MNLPRIKGILEFHEIDESVERIYKYYKFNAVNLLTNKQEIDIIDSPHNGKMIFMDGVLQSTTQDEVIYHNALVHPLLNTLICNKHILILGGGEGATAREVLRWSTVEVTMVDYDKEFVDYMKANGMEWSRGAFNDVRLTTLYEDAWEFMKEGNSYDGVIIDLTDPDFNKERWSPLLRMVLDSVKLYKGGFVMNAGLYLPWDTTNLINIVAVIKDLCLKNNEFRYYIYTAYIPSFNGEWTFISVIHKHTFMTEPDQITCIPEWIRRSLKVLPDSLLNPVSTDPNISKIII
jgi:spermidine synthase